MCLVLCCWSKCKVNICIFLICLLLQGTHYFVAPCGRRGQGWRVLPQLWPAVAAAKRWWAAPVSHLRVYEPEKEWKWVSRDLKSSTVCAHHQKSTRLSHPLSDRREMERRSVLLSMEMEGKVCMLSLAAAQAMKLNARCWKVHRKECMPNVSTQIISSQVIQLVETDITAKNTRKNCICPCKIV